MKINSESLGIFPLNDGRLIHFSCQLHDGERMTMVEVFNRQGKLEGMGRLKKFTIDGTTTGAQIGYIWKDKNDRFYFIDHRNIPG